MDDATGNFVVTIIFVFGGFLYTFIRLEKIHDSLERIKKELHIEDKY